MKIIGIILVVLNMAYGNEVGWSVYPLQENQKMVTAQFGGVFSGNGGFGVNASYLQKLSPKWDLEGGVGYTGGDRGFTIYGAGNYEIFPDYDNQPKVTLKGWYQYADEYEDSINRFYATPIVSKAILLWGHEAFPYFSIPTGFSLNYDNKNYAIFSTMAVGISGNIPFEKMKNILMLVEARINISGAYSGLNFGFSYPL